MHNTRQVRLIVVFCAGLLLFTGCKDLFHPDGPETVYYTVTFNTDGGSPSTQTQTVESGDTVGSSNMPSNPARNGYIFEGWYTGQNGNGSRFTYDTTVNGNMTVYAKWTISQYTVTFNADGGSPATQTRTVTNGSSVGSSNMPSDPTRSGYTFGGWYTEQNGNGSQFTYSSPVTGNMTVYAQWTISQYTVTFDADGGSPATQTRGVNNGASLGSSDMPSEPTRDGYTFGGWYTEQNGNGSPFTYSSMVNGNMTVYAKWTISQYTVTFNADGGSPATQTKMVASGGSIGSSNMPSEPTRSGYTFDGWYTEQNGSGSLFTYSSTVNGNMTVYAKWTVSQYTVTFDATVGSPQIQTRTITNGCSVGSSNMPSTPTRSGYTFGGWYTEANNGGSEFTGGTTVTGNITVYARWTAETPIQYTVTFDADGGSPATQIRTVTNGSSIGSSNMPSEPTRNGYTFGGWYTEQNDSGSLFTYFSTVNGNMTVYANWTKATLPSNLSLDEALTWISNNAATGDAYTITLRNNETIVPRSLGYSGQTVDITLTGGITERLVSLRSAGSLFTVESGVTLTLGNNVTLQGWSDNTGSLVLVHGGTLVMNDGSKICENTWYPAAANANAVGGGVFVSSGTFTMNGGEISGNTSAASPSFGGGVFVYSGMFTMNDGEISGNTSAYGGGVFVSSSGTFTMSGGEISGNTSATVASPSSGGGVSVSSGGTFSMRGGTISGNTSSSYYSSSYGGGVSVDGGTFSMRGGTISGNTSSSSSSSGGGVSVSSRGIFSMSGGIISGNTSSSYYSSSYGGGVSVSSGGTFTKQSGGIIYGSNENNSTLKNTAASNHGHAVYVDGSSAKIRNTTANASISLNSAVSGSAGGWE
ncbi:MAG: InlB B-repeat-containing protein [Treponema sp.]|jgi:uncharacterized repeat protein (TIGR02543 family)|nr:InlB B-repeat-containing protein [Treponema sp.]